MFARFTVIAVLALAIGALTLGSGNREASAADKYATLDPTEGVVGTVVNAELFNAPANDDITVIFKIPGDPVLATGTTDANGHAAFTFTIPYVPGGGTWPVYFTNFKCSCQVQVPFTVINSRPTPTPTATATVPIPTATPTVPPSTPTAIPTNTPTPTPAVPVLGNTTGNGPGGGPNAGILALGGMAVIAVLSLFAATRRPAKPMPQEIDPDEYSTHL
ncbi:MAG: hypothetical protein AB7J35_15060 [Dehalococcoidia bacterium]